VKVSLGLLPSGPDPVGEDHVRANLPCAISDSVSANASSRSWRTACPLAGRPWSLRCRPQSQVVEFEVLSPDVVELSVDVVELSPEVVELSVTPPVFGVVMVPPCAMISVRLAVGEVWQAAMMPCGSGGTPWVTFSVIAPLLAEPVVTELSVPEVLSEDIVLSADVVLPEDIVLSDEPVLSEDVVLPEDIVLSDEPVLSEDVVLPEDIVLSEEPVLSEDVVLPEDIVLSADFELSPPMTAFWPAVIIELSVLPEPAVLPDEAVLPELVPPPCVAIKLLT